jgi:hypothetical protein
MGRKDKTWLVDEPTARRTGWRFPKDVIDGVGRATFDEDTTEERLATKWLRQKIEQHGNEQQQRKRKAKP